MGLFDKLRGELIDIIAWPNQPASVLVWKFPRYNNEIKNGAQLTVRPGQQAVFVHQGELADVFGEGQYELSTPNMPILSTLAGWKYGFNSPFKCDVFFISTRQATDLKWGTPNPIPLRDPDFGRIRIRAFGTYAIKAIDPKPLIRELAASQEQFDFSAVDQLMRSMIVEAFTDFLGESSIPAMDLAANYREFSEGIRKLVCERIDDEYGLEVTQLFIVNISFPEAVEQAIDTRAAMGAIGDMNQYQQYQVANALPMAAANTGGGGASEGMGLGMGMAMASQMMNAFQPGQAAAGSGPPPPPAAVAFHIVVNGQTEGPFDFDGLSGQVTAGRLATETMVWNQALGDWTPAGQVPQLAGLFSTPPPPPPPPPPPAPA